MKTLLCMKYRHFAVAALLLISVCAYPQAKFSKVYKWEGDIDSDAEIELKNFDTDLSISTSENNKVIFKYILIAEAEDQKDIDVLNEYMTNLSFDIKKEKAAFSTIFWKNRTTDQRLGKEKIKITLKNGKTIVLSELRLKAELYIPAKSYLTLDTRHSDVKIGELYSFNLKSFDDKIITGDINKDLSVNAKYSDLIMGSSKNTSLDLFDCDFTAGCATNLSINSKYSDISFNSCTNLSITSFDDDVFFEHAIVNFSCDAKYSDFTLKMIRNASLSMFDSDFTINESKNLSIGSSKYSDINIKSVCNMTLGKSFDDDYEIGKVNNIDISEMKYTDLEIELLRNNLNLIGFENEVEITEVSPECERITIDQKHGEIKLNLPDELNLTLVLEYTYGSFENNLSNLVITGQETNTNKTSLKARRGDTGKKTEITIDLFEVDLVIGGQ